MAGAPLSLVQDAGELPDYPFGRDDALPGNYFLKWQTAAWFQSDMWLRAEPEVGYAYLNLIFKSQASRPIGTIPADPEGQIALLENRYTPQKWRALCRLEPGPLHRWRRYLCEGGEIRLGHEVVIDSIRDQMTRREQSALSRERDATRQRVTRLREKLAERGVHEAVLADATLMERMDDWLAQNWRGNRNFRAYDRVMLVAAQEGWFNRKM